MAIADSVSVKLALFSATATFALPRVKVIVLVPPAAIDAGLNAFAIVAGTPPACAAEIPSINQQVDIATSTTARRVFRDIAFLPMSCGRATSLTLAFCRMGVRTTTLERTAVSAGNKTA
jgi:hypothetical protein